MTRNVPETQRGACIRRWCWRWVGEEVPHRGRDGAWGCRFGLCVDRRAIFGWSRVQKKHRRRASGRSEIKINEYAAAAVRNP